MSVVDKPKVLEVVREAVDAGTAGRVFGTPVADNGVVVLPVAKVGGFGGGGGGTGPTEDGVQPEGSGGGFGTAARGLGVFVLREGRVSWRPAIDVNRIVLGGQVVAVVALLVLRGVLRGRAAQGPRGRAGRCGPMATRPFPVRRRRRTSRR